MPYYQNVFDREFRGSWVLGDRQYVIDFNCRANINKSNYLLAWNIGPYDFSAVNTLTINYAWDIEFKNYSTLAINVAGATPAATTATEVATLLNANAIFAGLFVASVLPSSYMSPVPPSSDAAGYTVIITPRSGRPKPEVRVYISNGGAETKLRFNKKAGVANLPTYMDRHLISNRFAAESIGATGSLLRVSQSITAIAATNPGQVTSVAHGLTTGDTVYIVGSNSTPTIDGARVVTVTSVDVFTVPVNVVTAGTRAEFLTANNYQIVSEADIDYTTYLFDWQLLSGRTGLFTFQKLTVDGSNRITQIIEYPTGARAGDFARLTNYTYTAANTNPSTVTMIPYVLAAGDIILPP